MPLMVAADARSLRHRPRRHHPRGRERSGLYDTTRAPATPLRRYERSSRGLTSGSPRPLATAEPPPPVANS